MHKDGSTSSVEDRVRREFLSNPLDCRVELPDSSLAARFVFTSLIFKRCGSVGSPTGRDNDQNA